MYTFCTCRGMKEHLLSLLERQYGTKKLRRRLKLARGLAKGMSALYLDAHSMCIQSALISSALFTPFYECACDAHRTNPPREVVSIRIEVDPLANCGARRIVT